MNDQKKPLSLQIRRLRGALSTNIKTGELAASTNPDCTSLPSQTEIECPREVLSSMCTTRTIASGVNTGGGVVPSAVCMVGGGRP